MRCHVSVLSFLLVLACAGVAHAQRASQGGAAPAAAYADLRARPDAPAREGDALLGTWLVASRNARVRIERHGETYLGTLTWIAHPVDASGNVKRDRNNPDPRLRDQPMVGLTLLRNFRPGGDRTWEGGEIYDPQHGRSYRCRLTLSPDHRTLTVRGYVGISLFGRSQEWTRVGE